MNSNWSEFAGLPEQDSEPQLPQLQEPLRELCPALVNGKGLLIIGAHPEDEVIGAGGQIANWLEARFVHVTDGAPRDMSDALRHGFEDRESYASARRRELEAALACACVPPSQLQSLELVDQETSGQLPFLVRKCFNLIRDLSPSAILTHAYEGGHPDHDSTAFAVHTACRLLHTEGVPCPQLLEMTSYHNEAGSMQSRQFLFCATRRPVTAVLDPQQRNLKKQMFDCFETQRFVLQWLPVDFESFRLAPEYNFLEPPHAGVLYYELFNWGTSGQAWRRAAQSAMLELGIPPVPQPRTQEEADSYWRLAS